MKIFNNPDKNVPEKIEQADMVAAETRNGVLLFSNTPMGEAGLHAYMQHIADHFFDPAPNDHVSLHYKFFDGNDDFINKNSDTCFQRIPVIYKNETIDNSPDNFYDFKQPSFLEMNVLADFVPAFRFDINSGYEAYKRLTDTFGLKDSVKNVNIKILSDIYANGFNAQSPQIEDSCFLFDNLFAMYYRDKYPAIMQGIKENDPEAKGLENIVKAFSKQALDTVLSGKYDKNFKQLSEKKPLVIAPPKKNTRHLKH